MPITWTVSRPMRPVVAIAKGDTCTADVLLCLDEISQAGARPYRKIFDLSGVIATLSTEDVPLVGMRVVALTGDKPTGPLAIVVASNAVAELTEVFEATAVTKRQAMLAPAARVVRRTQ